MGADMPLGKTQSESDSADLRRSRPWGFKSASGHRTVTPPRGLVRTTRQRARASPKSAVDTPLVPILSAHAHVRPGAQLVGNWRGRRLGEIAKPLRVRLLAHNALLGLLDQCREHHPISAGRDGRETLSSARDRVQASVVGREREPGPGPRGRPRHPPGGASGTSKSSLLRAITAQWGIPLVFVEGNSDLTPAKLVRHHNPARVSGHRLRRDDRRPVRPPLPGRDGGGHPEKVLRQIWEAVSVIIYERRPPVYLGISRRRA
jgi:hypothetical protein